MQRASTTSRTLLASERRDNPDGYAWKATFGFSYSDGTSTRWQLSGTLSRRPEGVDWQTEFTLLDGPADLPPGSQVRSVRAAVDYDTSRAATDATGRRPATIRVTIVHDDGAERETVDSRLLSAATENPSIEDQFRRSEAKSAVRDLPFPKVATPDAAGEPSAPRDGSGEAAPLLPPWFCTESCASGCIEFIELPIGYAACVAACMGVCLAD